MEAESAFVSPFASINFKVFQGTPTPPFYVIKRYSIISIKPEHALASRQAFLLSITFQG